MMMTVDWKPIAIGVASAFAGAAVTVGVLFATGISDLNKIAYNMTRNFVYLDVSDVYIQAGNPINVAVTVISNDIPVSSAPITFYVNGTKFASDITNKDGKADMIFYLSPAGKYIIYAQSDNMTSNAVTVVVY
jgi:hypothetical protein